ncbi:MAG TPA: hypothetical protein VHB99_12485, partial [Pirellulales bacterium]|nr:hypothetical protein [Pirellulales bacterium]
MFDSNRLAGKANHVPMRQPLPKNNRNALHEASLHPKTADATSCSWTALALETTGFRGRPRNLARNTVIQSQSVGGAGRLVNAPRSPATLTPRPGDAELLHAAAKRIGMQRKDLRGA